MKLAMAVMAVMSVLATVTVTAMVEVDAGWHSHTVL